MAVPARPVVAVVQFHNETGDASHDRLAQQLTDAAVVALAQDPGLAVIGNAAVLRTPRIFSDLVTIRDTLHADAIIVAQLQNPPAGLTVRLHFIRASDQTHVWATNVPAAEASVVGAALEGAARTVR
jgi:TolB-like protein